MVFMNAYNYHEMNNLIVLGLVEGVLRRKKGQNKNNDVMNLVQHTNVRTYIHI